MKNECNIIRDILPLFVENMTCEDTDIFVKEHLQNCPECLSVLDTIRKGHIPAEESVDASEKDALAASLAQVRKKITGRIAVTVLLICLGIGGIIGLLQIFPVYRVFLNEWDNSFTISERKMLAYIGSPEDRAIAKTVLNKAEIAFSDISHTMEENMVQYGELGRYAFDRYYFGVYFDAVAETHTIELLSAHIEDRHGYIFIEYSQEAIDANGDSVSGSWNVVSLWEIEKDENGNWNVISIKEHP